MILGRTPGPIGIKEKVFSIGVVTSIRIKIIMWKSFNKTCSSISRVKINIIVFESMFDFHVVVPLTIRLIIGNYVGSSNKSFS